MQIVVIKCEVLFLKFFVFTIFKYIIQFQIFTYQCSLFLFSHFISKFVYSFIIYLLFIILILSSNLNIR